MQQNIQNTCELWNLRPEEDMLSKAHLKMEQMVAPSMMKKSHAQQQ